MGAVPLTVGGVLAQGDLGVVCWNCGLCRLVVQEAVGVPRKQKESLLNYVKAPCAQCSRG